MSTTSITEIIPGYPAHIAWVWSVYGMCREERPTGVEPKRAYLRGAYLRDAVGIRAAGPVGRSARMIYGVAHEGGARIRCGCWWGTLEDTLARVEEKYAGSDMLDDYMVAVRWVGGVR